MSEVDDELIEKMAEAIYNADNGIDGDQIGVMLHDNFRIEAESVVVQIEQVKGVCREGARAALQAIRDAGYVLVPSCNQKGELISRNVWWTEKARALPDAEKERIISEIESRADAMMNDVVAVPVEQLRDMYQRFRELTALGQTDARKLLEEPEDVRKIKREVFRLAEFGALFAGQWLPKETNDTIDIPIPCPL